MVLLVYSGGGPSPLLLQHVTAELHQMEQMYVDSRWVHDVLFGKFMGAPILVIPLGKGSRRV
jgi:hypothetical protein